MGRSTTMSRTSKGANPRQLEITEAFDSPSFSADSLLAKNRHCRYFELVNRIWSKRTIMVNAENMGFQPKAATSGSGISNTRSVQWARTASCSPTSSCCRLQRQTNRSTLRIAPRSQKDRDGARCLAGMGPLFPKPRPAKTNPSLANLPA